MSLEINGKLKNGCEAGEKNREWLWSVQDAFNAMMCYMNHAKLNMDENEFTIIWWPEDGVVMTTTNAHCHVLHYVCSSHASCSGNIARDTQDSRILCGTGNQW